MSWHHRLAVHAGFHASLPLILAIVFISGLVTSRSASGQYVFEPSGTNSANWTANNRWRIDGVLTGTNFPNAADATATFNLPISTSPSATFTIGMGSAPGDGSLTIGSITVNNAVGNNFDTQFGTSGIPGSLVFQVSDGSASFTETAGTSTGSTLVRSRITLLSNFIVTQDHIDSDNLNTGTNFSGMLNAGSGITFTKEGNSNLSLTNTTAPTGGDGFLGSYVINQGALRFISDALLKDAAGVTVNAGGQLQIGGSVTSLSLGAGASLKLNGDGVSGGPSNDAGALRFQTSSGVTTVFSSPIEVDSEAEINVNPSGAIAHLSNVISGDGGLVKSGSGNLHLIGSQSNTHAGGTGALDGQLVLAKAGGAIAVPGLLNIGGSSIVVVQQNEQIADDALVRFTSTTQEGILRVGGLNRQETVGGILSVNFNSGIIEANNPNAESVATLTIAGVHESKFDGLIRDNGNPVAQPGKLAIAKTGSESLELTNSNTYSGGTIVSGGTLLVNNATGSGTGTGDVVVNDTGTIGGTGAIAGAVTLNSGGHLAPGASIESLDVGSLVLNNGSFLDFELGAPGSPGVNSDLLNVTIADGLTISGGSLVLTDAGGLAAGTYTLIDYAGVLNGEVGNLGTPVGPSGFSYSLLNNLDNTTIDLIVSADDGIPGDYNQDNVVDAADYVLWRKSPLLFGGAEGYQTWVDHFGETTNGGGGSLTSWAVPEPATTVLVALLAALSMIRRRPLWR